MNTLKILPVAIMLLTTTATYAKNPAYRVKNTLHVRGNGRWDYLALCPANDYLYVSHQTQVNIINKNTGDSIGVIPNTEGVHGICFVPDLKKGYTSNGKLNTVTVFDLKTNNILTQIKTGENPDAIMYDKFSGKIYVCNGHSNSLSVINPATDEVIKTIELSGKPETAVTNEAGKLYVNIEDKNEIAVVNTKSYQVEHQWKIGKGESPSGLAIDIKTKRLFAGCENKLLIVVDAVNGSIIKELPIGSGCDGVAFDGSSRHIFSANGEGTLTVIEERSANNFAVIANVATKKGARTLAVDNKTHNIYLPTADFDDKMQPGQKRPNPIPGSFSVLVVGK